MQQEQQYRKGYATLNTHAPRANVYMQCVVFVYTYSRWWACLFMNPQFSGFWAKLHACENFLDFKRNSILNRTFKIDIMYIFITCTTRRTTEDYKTKSKGCFPPLCLQWISIFHTCEWKLMVYEGVAKLNYDTKMCIV